MLQGAASPKMWCLQELCKYLSIWILLTVFLLVNSAVLVFDKKFHWILMCNRNFTITYICKEDHWYWDVLKYILKRARIQKVIENVELKQHRLSLSWARFKFDFFLFWQNRYKYDYFLNFNNWLTSLRRPNIGMFLILSFDNWLMICKQL